VVFDDVFHFAAIVGGRSKIEGDPMMVALDLAIDAEFFTGSLASNPQEHCSQVLLPLIPSIYKQTLLL